MSYCVHHPQTELESQQCARCESWFCPNCTVRLDNFLLCSDCKMEHVRDAYCGVKHGQLDLASIGQRFVAVTLDSILFIAPYVLSMVLLVSLEGSGSSTSDSILVFIFLTSLFLATFGRVIYEGFMLQYRGQTLGKMAMKIKVVTPQGQDLRAGQAWGRSVGRFLLDGCLSGVSYLPALFTEEKTGLHDLLAKTRVIRHRK